MGSDLVEKSAAARALYDEADKILGWSLSEVSFRGPAESLTETRVCQPALYVHGLALLAAYQNLAGKHAPPTMPPPDFPWANTPRTPPHAASLLRRAFISSPSAVA